MGRPAREHEPVAVKISAGPKLIQYLDDIASEEFHGTSRPKVAEAACWILIQEMIKNGLIKQRSGSNDT